MDIVINGNFHVTNHIKGYFEEKVSKFNKLFTSPVTMHVNVLHEGNGYTIETSFISGKKSVHLKEKGQQPLEVIDKVVDKLERVIIKEKDIKQIRHSKKSLKNLSLDTEDEEEFNEYEIKYINIKPIGVEEAKVILDGNNYDFYPFVNDETGEINIIYKKKNGYGLYIQNK